MSLPIKRAKRTMKSKVFNDSIHGQITMDGLCVAIIDTPQFQRLRFMKQLGSTYFVYPAASHNRFEHSLGVSHLAGEFAKRLKCQHDEITDNDVLCIKVAGLCHDLGHGPFSHLWQLYITKMARSNNETSNWKHENASVTMLRFLLKENDIKMEDYNLSNESVDFIGELIVGLSKEKLPKHKGEQFSYLYEIVSNQRNGIDVDKWDYFLRDSHNLGLTITFDYRYLINDCKVLEFQGKRQICLRDKHSDSVIDMFYGRYLLHKKAYQHRVSSVIDNMLLDAFEKVDRFVTFRNSKNKSLSLAESVTDMSAYWQVTDDILQQILRLNLRDYITRDADNIMAAQTLITNIFRRMLYPTIGITESCDGVVKRKTLEGKIKEHLGQRLVNGHSNGHSTSCAAAQCSCHTEQHDQHIIVHKATFSYGNKDKSPIDNVTFYRKAADDREFEAYKETDIRSRSLMLPNKYQEIKYHVMSRNYCETCVQRYTRAFKAACCELKLRPAASP